MLDNTLLDNLKGEFALLGIDLADLNRLRKERAAIESKRDAARSELNALRPGAKDYEAETTRLANLVLAFDGQLTSANDAIMAEVKRLKAEACENQPALGDLRAEAKRLDVEAVKALLSAYELLCERQSVQADYESRAGLVASYAYELGRNAPPELRNAWNKPFPTWPGIVEEFIGRFSKMVLATNRPEPGQELTWFSRRIW